MVGIFLFDKKIDHVYVNDFADENSVINELRSEMNQDEKEVTTEEPVVSNSVKHKGSHKYAFRLTKIPTTTEEKKHQDPVASIWTPEVAESVVVCFFSIGKI